MGWASGFEAGSRLGQGLIDTYQDAKKRKEKEEAVAEGKRASTESVDEISTYGVVDPNTAYEGPGAEPVAANPNPEDPTDVPAPRMTNAEAATYGISVPKEDKAAGTGVTRSYGLGLDPKQWQSTPFTADQKRIAGMTAQSDYYQSQGNVDEAGKIRSALNAESRDKRQNERWDMEDKKAKAEEAYQAGLGTAFAGTVYGQKQAQHFKEFEAYNKALQQYEKGVANGLPADMVGEMPVAPKPMQITPMDQLATDGAMLAYAAKNNRIDPQSVAAFGDRMRKISEEGTFQALSLAQSGAALPDVVKAFNAAGIDRLSVDTVISDTMVKNSMGVPERIITYKGAGGKPETFNVMSQMHSLGKAKDAYETFFAGERNRQADERLALDKERIQGDRDARLSNKAEVSEQRVIAEADRFLKPFEDRLARSQEAITKATENVMRDNPGAKQDEIDKHPAVMQAKSAFRQAKVSQMRAQTDAWQRSGGKVGTGPDFYANEILSGAKNPADVMTSLGQISKTFGTDFADQTGRMIESSDSWKQMTTPAPEVSTPAGATNTPAASKTKPAATTTPPEPKGPKEFQQVQEALQKRFDAVGRGNAGLFGSPEILYKSRETGELVWASKLFGK
jgi:hypothetical protein